VTREYQPTHTELRPCDVGACSRWYPRTQLQAALHFVSGVNSPGEVSGLADNAFNIGITCGEIRTGLLKALELYADRCNQRLFVDSAAFSEVEFNPELSRLVVVKPITDAQWEERFDLYRWAAKTYGRRAYVVAPDQVGDQAATFARMQKFAAQMREVAALGALVIVPVQKGELPMSKAFRHMSDLLGIPSDQLVAGVPMQKDTTSMADIAELAISLLPGQRLHLLGIGPKARYGRYQAAIDTVRRCCPFALVTSDSAVLVSLVGRSNGRGGSARALTRYQDDARGEGFRDAAVKDVAIRRWRQDLYSIEDAYDCRATARQLGVG
jgi:hypothetical protein